MLFYSSGTCVNVFIITVPAEIDVKCPRLMFRHGSKQSGSFTMCNWTFTRSPLILIYLIHVTSCSFSPFYYTIIQFKLLYNHSVQVTIQSFSSKLLVVHSVHANIARHMNEWLIMKRSLV